MKRAKLMSTGLVLAALCFVGVIRAGDLTLDGNLTVSSNFTVSGSSSLDAGGVATDGSGNLTVSGVVTTAVTVAGTNMAGTLTVSGDAQVSGRGLIGAVEDDTVSALQILGGTRIVPTDLTGLTIEAALVQLMLKDAAAPADNRNWIMTTDSANAPVPCLLMGPDNDDLSAGTSFLRVDRSGNLATYIDLMAPTHVGQGGYGSLPQTEATALTVDGLGGAYPAFQVNGWVALDYGLITSDGFGDLTAGGMVSFDNGMVTTDGSGNLTVGGTITSGGGAVMTLDGSGNFSMGGSITATQLVGGSLSLDNAAITSDGYGNLTVGGTVSADGGLVTSDGLGGLTASAFYGNGSTLTFDTLTVVGGVSVDNAAITSDGYGNLTVGGTMSADGGLVTSDGAGLLSVSRLVVGPNTASGDYSTAFGSNTVASGFSSHAEGWWTTAEGRLAHAEGEGTLASLDASHAEGTATSAGGYASHAEGDTTSADGFGAHAEGFLTTASGVYSHAAGQSAHADHDNTYVWADGNETQSTTNQQYTVHAANGIRLLGGTTEAAALAVAGEARFTAGIAYVAPRGDLSMGSYTNGF
jgi:hypothetical protein